MSNVVNLADPNQTVQQVLEALLEKAKNGEIESFMGFYLGVDSFYKAHAGNFEVDALFKYIGLLEVVKQEMALSLMADQEAEE